ncbi:unnamed protein product, partial [Prorocentrum cordatum]
GAAAALQRPVGRAAARAHRRGRATGARRRRPAGRAAGPAPRRGRSIGPSRHAQDGPSGDRGPQGAPAAAPRPRGGAEGGGIRGARGGWGAAGPLRAQRGGRPTLHLQGGDPLFDRLVQAGVPDVDRASAVGFGGSHWAQREDEVGYRGAARRIRDRMDM